MKTINARPALSAALLALFLAAPSVTQAAPLPLSDADKREMQAEIKQGAEVAEEVAKQVKFVDDKAKVDRVNAIGQRLAAVANVTQYPAGFGNDHVYPFTWDFHIIQDKDVNAFSLPGGHVYINSGLLDMVRSDDELAGVLGHEITHAAHHHIAALSHEQSKMNTEMMLGILAAIFAHVPSQDVANLAAGAQYAQLGIMNTRYSQAAEQDADHGGTILMKKAGFDPVGMLTFMQRLSDIEKRSPEIDLGILRDHPYTSERVGLIKAELAQMQIPITTQAVREVSGAARVTVKSNGITSQMTYADQTVATLADPDGSRAQAAADQINDLLDGGLQLFQVKAESGVLLADDQPVLVLTSADAALRPGASPAILAEEASHALRTGLYAQAFVVNRPGD